jgi:hypothetical protein
MWTLLLHGSLSLLCECVNVGTPSHKQILIERVLTDKSGE